MKSKCARAWLVLPLICQLCSATGPLFRVAEPGLSLCIPARQLQPSRISNGVVVLHRESSDVGRPPIRFRADIFPAGRGSERRFTVRLGSARSMVGASGAKRFGWWPFSLHGTSESCWRGHRGRGSGTGAGVERELASAVEVGSAGARRDGLATTAGHCRSFLLRTDDENGETAGHSWRKWHQPESRRAGASLSLHIVYPTRYQRRHPARQGSG